MILNNKYAILGIALMFITNDVGSYPTDKRSLSVDDEYYTKRTIRYQNHIYKDKIMTPVVNLTGEPLSYPYLKLNTQETIEFYFDDLSENQGDYYYTVVHCTFDWKPSDLMTSEFIDGFDENAVSDFQNSFNTFVNYTNYRVTLPNSDLAFRKSGNYVLLIYENGDKSQPVVTYRFIVYESLVQVGIDISRPSDVDDMNYKQEVDFTIDHGAVYLSDPFREIKVAVLQNNRWDNAKTSLEPQFIQNKKLIYDYNDEGSFEGGNEFRYLDLKSSEFLGAKIDNIVLKNGIYEYDFEPELKRSYLQYLSQQDINGQFIIKEENDQNSHTDADYVRVKLALPVSEPFTEGSVYLFGGLSMWEINDALKMDYHAIDEQYYIEFLIKQGYYNYLYGIPEATGRMNTTLIEGTHYETENNYTVLVYQKMFSEGYDRIIGMEVKNSRDL